MTSFATHAAILRRCSKFASLFVAFAPFGFHYCHTSLRLETPGDEILPRAVKNFWHSIRARNFWPVGLEVPKRCHVYASRGAGSKLSAAWAHLVLSIRQQLVMTMVAHPSRAGEMRGMNGACFARFANRIETKDDAGNVGPIRAIRFSIQQPQIHYEQAIIIVGEFVRAGRCWQKIGFQSGARSHDALSSAFHSSMARK